MKWYKTKQEYHIHIFFLAFFYCRSCWSICLQEKKDLNLTECWILIWADFCCCWILQFDFQQVNIRHTSDLLNRIPIILFSLIAGHEKSAHKRFYTQKNTFVMFAKNLIVKLRNQFQIPNFAEIICYRTYSHDMRDLKMYSRKHMWNRSCFIYRMSSQMVNISLQ